MTPPGWQACHWSATRAPGLRQQQRIVAEAAAGPVRYAGILSDGEKQLHKRLESLLHDVSPAEKETLAFAEVKALMARLGLRSP